MDPIDVVSKGIKAANIGDFDIGGGWSYAEI